LAYYKVYDYENSNKFIDIALTIREAYPDATTLKQKLTLENIDKAKLGKLIELQESSIKNEKDPNKLGELYEQLCKLQFSAKEYGKAVEAAEEVIKINPKNYTVNFLKAISAFKSGDAATGATLLERMVKIPNLNKESEATFYFCLGLMHKTMGNTELSYKAFKSSAVGPFKFAAMAEVKSLLASSAGGGGGGGGEDDGEDDTTNDGGE
jgi:tetratricopeptide (TPR) repeat protein